jgi:NodT family efflux transporter outer membrane factor (OMF) lipoprotein
MKSAVFAIALIAAATCGLQACASHPALRPQRVAPVQSVWEAAPAAPADAVASATGAWWERFNDPVLDGLMRRALTQNLDLKLAQARILEARAERRAATAAQWPVFSAAASDEFSHLPPTLAQPGAPQRDLGASLDATWTVDVFGRARYAARAAAAELRASEFDAGNVRLNLIAEIATDYVDYRLYQSQYAIAVRSAASQAETVRITRVRFDQGAASRLDVARVESELAITRAAVPQAVEQAATAKSLLVLLLATTPEALAADLPDTIPETPNLPVSDPLAVLLTPAEVIARRPDVSSAEQRLLAAAANLKAALAERYPQLTLGALFGTSGSAVNQLMSATSRTWSYGGGLTLPLFDFGRIRAAIDAADAQQLEAYITYEQTVRGALQATQSAVVRYAQGVLRARELATALDAARLAEKLARRQYQEGVLSLLEVLDAERTAYDTELTWSLAAAAVSERLIDLYRMMGILPSLN